MITIAVVDEFLFPVFAAFNRGPEVPDLRCLEGRAERAESRINISCLLPDRTVIDSLDELYGIPAREWGANRVSGFMLDNHAEPGKQVIEETEPDAAVTAAPALVGDHAPV
jgi:hypothetical protein